MPFLAIYAKHYNSTEEESISVSFGPKGNLCVRLAWPLQLHPNLNLTYRAFKKN